MATQKKRKKKNSPLPLATVAVFGAAALVTLIVYDHTPRSESMTVGENSAAVSELPAQTTVTTEGTAMLTTDTTTELTTTVTEATQPLPPGSVTDISLTFYSCALKVGGNRVMPIVTMTPETAPDKSEKWESSDPAVATVDGIGWITPVGAGKCTVKVTSVNNPAVFAEVVVSVTDPNAPVAASTVPIGGTAPAETAAPAESTPSGSSTTVNGRLEVKDGITYIDGIMIVNKTYSLPASYDPGALTPDADQAFAMLQKAAKIDGLTMNCVSGYRSYQAQDTLYHNYIARDGQAAADRFSARPGHSEHQTGLCLDVNYAGDAFHDTPEAKWLEENSWKYGFIIRYPKGKEDITGFKYESWHIRYVGTDYAKLIYESGLCLEEYFGIESKYAE
ncbi:MAG: D-alanyl-D-alanine carboxypeptidase family protein [Oscillospiraceae bacterium]|nr:D-alanyl-D-alanine carboxypeptidase family protein [Oscillospiraceae bacterium]